MGMNLWGESPLWEYLACRMRQGYPNDNIPVIAAQAVVVTGGNDRATSVVSENGRHSIYP